MKKTVARKRASVAKTCMECRATHPIEIVVSGRTTVLDAEKKLDEVTCPAGNGIQPNC